MTRTIGAAAIADMLVRERERYVQRNPRSQAHATAAAKHWLRGVPMHWMDWGSPFPLFIASANGAEVVDADGNRYADFCLGDTGALFGHSPKAIVEVLHREAASGLTITMPSTDADVVGRLLEERFALPCWQVTTTASDANRAVIRWCRAITGRSKILIFNHGYHGAVDDIYVTIDGGTPRMTAGLVGEPRDLTQYTKVVELNDVPALEAALAPGDVACVLTEPYLTNAGIVLPDAGFHDQLREITRRTGTLLILDETHTLSSGPGGHGRELGLDPDGIVFGKPVGGGVPAAAYGFSRAVAERIHSYLAVRPAGHSGIGTTLSGSRIQLALMRAMLETYFTKETFAPMVARAEQLERGIAEVIRRHEAPWHVVRVGARVELVCSPVRARTGGEAAKLIRQPVDQAVHDYLLNRGVIITPFDNLMLACPSTTAEHVQRLVEHLDGCLAELAP